MTEFITVATFNFPHEIVVLKSILEHEGIPYLFQNENHPPPFTIINICEWTWKFKLLLQQVIVVVRVRFRVPELDVPPSPFTALLFVDLSKQSNLLSIHNLFIISKYMELILWYDNESLTFISILLCIAVTSIPWFLY